MHLNNHIKFWTQLLRGKYPIRHAKLTQPEKARMEYCFKINDNFTLSSSAISANSITLFTKAGYAYDWYKMISRKNARKCDVLFGDIQFVPESPSFCKSRPISDFNQNNVIIPLNTHRHFSFIQDNIPFRNKRDYAIWRGAAYKSHRKLFLSQTQGVDKVDAQDTSRDSKQTMLGKSTQFLSREDQIRNKFIFAIEGNDVASNLKWVMASNVVAIMPKPRFETWFCEGRLVPGQHFVEISADFTDIGEVLEYYLSRPKLSEEIASESTEYAKHFLNLERQFGTARHIIDAYFSLAS